MRMPFWWMGVLVCSMWVGFPATSWAVQPSGFPTGKGQVVTVSELEEALFQEISRRYGNPAHSLSIRVLYPNMSLPVPDGTVRLEVSQLSGGRTGRRSFRLKVFVDGRFHKMVNVVGELKVKVTAPLPVRWIKPKEIVTLQDVEVSTIEVPSLTHDFVVGLDDVVGKQVLRPLSPNRPIRHSFLDSPPLIQKGDRVVLEVKAAGLLVQTIGLAKSAGRAGETISVQNQNSGREVLGTVVAAGTVEIPF